MAYESRLSLVVDSRAGERNLKRFRGELDQTERRGARTFGSLNKLVAGLSGALVGLGAGAYFKRIITDSQEFESRMLSINALIKANGAAAGFTANQLRKQAEALALGTLQSTRGVMDAQKVLLSFRRVSGDTFTEAIALSADLSAVMGGDMSSAALQLGKALENPIEGMSALSRSGTTFTQAQKDAVRAMVETNRLAEAQALILAEVRSQVGGAGEGQAGGLAGAFDTLGQRVEELGLALAESADKGGIFKSVIDSLAYAAQGIQFTFFDDETEAANLFERQIELQEELNRIREDGFKRYSAAGNRVREIEAELAEVTARRRELVEANEKAIREQNQAEIDGKEKQLQMEKNAASERIAVEREKRAEISRIAEASRKSTVDGIVAQLQGELAALELSERALLERELGLANATQSEQALALAAFDTAQALRDQAAATREQADAYAQLIGQLDPAQAELNRYFDTLEMIDRLNLGSKETDRLREAAYEQHWQKMAQIAGKGGKKAGDKAESEFSKEFINPWQSTADSVAQSLQTAIASGDWDTLGEGIGNALAVSMAAVVSDTITAQLSKGLTENSGALSQISAAFAGPIAGAVVGGLVQLAVSELSDFFSDDWDPTADRQRTQGTGTVLGSIEAKSESIAKATDIAADATSELVGINRAMLQALERLNAGIQGASARVAREAAGVNFEAPTVRQNAFSVGGFAGGLVGELPGGQKIIDNFASGFLNSMTLGLGNVVGKLLGGKSRQVDEGINIVGGYLSDLVDDVMVQSFATFRVKKNAWSSTKTREKYQALSDDARNQFSLVFEGILESVLAGADVFGVAASATEGFEVGTQKLSLEGLNAEEKQAEIEAYFGTVFDNLAEYTIPWLEEFQAAGEGLGETLARVSTQTQVTLAAVDQLSLQFSDLSGRELAEASQRLTELGGGIENFVSSMQGFIKNFASEERQFEIAQSGLTKALQQANLTIPKTRQGYYELLQAQDAATAAGAQNISTLLRLQGVASDYYEYLEGAEKHRLQQIESFMARFAGESTRFAIVQDRLNAAMEDASLLLPKTREGFYQLLKAQDESTAAGKSHADALLKVQGLADSYYSSLESAAADAERVAVQLAEEAKRAAESALQALRSETDDALAKLKQSVSERQKLLKDANRTLIDQIKTEADARIEANNLALDAAKAGVSAIKDELSGISSAAGQLRGSYDPMQPQRRQSAMSTLVSALRTGDLTGAGEAAGVAAEIDESRYATAADVRFEQARTLNLLSTLEGAGEDQLTTAEQAVQRLESQTQAIREESEIQIEAANDRLQKELDKLDRMLGEQQRQYNALRGIDVSVIGVNSAIVSLQRAMGEERRQLESTLQGIEENRVYSAKVPAFATGGSHTGGLRLVGEKGPELEVTGASRIFSNQQTRNMLDMSGVIAELKQVRAELSQVKQATTSTAAHTSKSSRQLERWDIDGTPKERAIV
jgi:hypothetical protein